MKYCKVLSLIVALSTALAYGMGKSEQGFKKYIISIDANAKGFSAQEWKNVIDNFLKPLVEYADTTGRDFTDVVREVIENDELKKGYFKYRTYVLLERTKNALEKLVPKLEREAEQRQRGAERRKQLKEQEQYEEYEHYKKLFQEEVGRPGTQEELIEFIRQKEEEEEEFIRGMYPERRVLTPEEQEEERKRLLEHQLKAKKQEAARLKKAKEDAKKAADQAMVLKSPAYWEKVKELENVQDNFYAAIEQLKALEVEKESLGKSKKELEQELREKEALLAEANRALEIIKRSQMTETEVKSEEQQKLMAQAKSDLYAAQEKVAEAEGAAAGVSNALIVVKADALRSRTIMGMYKAIQMNYGIVQRGLEKANQEIEEWFNSEDPKIDVLMNSLKNILENKEYTEAVKALYNQFYTAYKLPDDENKWDELTKDFKPELEYLVASLKVIENELRDLTKLPVIKPDASDKNKYNGFTRLNNYLSTKVNYFKLRPEEGGTVWSTGEYLYGALNRLAKALKLPRQ
jgi:hypothetical protein